MCVRTDYLYILLATILILTDIATARIISTMWAICMYTVIYDMILGFETAAVVSRWDIAMVRVFSSHICQEDLIEK